MLHLDADERVSAELAEELRRIFSADIEADGFMMPRKIIFRNKWIRYGWQYPVYQLRLFRKNKGRSEERFYDQHYIVEGRVLIINRDIINIINPDLKSWKERHRRWAYLEAQEVLFNQGKGRRMKARLRGNPIEKRNWLRYKVYYKMPLFMRVFLYFIYRYIIRMGFLDGVQGFIFHFWQGFWYRLLVDFNIYLVVRKK